MSNEKGSWGLIGSTGFVGSSLRRGRDFTGLYNSKNITEISGTKFDTLVCAGAPATMWAANRDPQRDADNLEDLASQIFRSRSRKVVLISTVAVFDRSDAGYTESKSSYETQKAYGKNRRWLEEALASEVSDLHVLRLPALFGPGLKKNFIFDLINPVPSFIAVDKFESVSRELSPGERELLGRWFVRDDQLNMHKYDRDGATRSGESRLLESVFSRIGFEAKTFTNSESRYQYYNVERLNDDIDTCIRGGLGVVNICSEPLSAKDICKQLFGVDFLNRAPPLVSEDVSVRRQVF